MICHTKEETNSGSMQAEFAAPWKGRAVGTDPWKYCCTDKIEGEVFKKISGQRLLF